MSRFLRRSWLLTSLALGSLVAVARAEEAATARPTQPVVAALLRALDAGDLAEVDRLANPVGIIDVFVADPWTLAEELLLAGQGDQARAFARRVRTADGEALRRYVEEAVAWPADLPARSLYLRFTSGRPFRDDAERGQAMTAPWQDPPTWGKSVSGLLTMALVSLLVRDAADTAVVTHQVTADLAKARGWSFLESMCGSEVADLSRTLAAAQPTRENVQRAHEAALRAAELVVAHRTRSDPRAVVVAQRNAALALLNRLIGGFPDLDDSTLYPKAVDLARRAVADATPAVPVLDRYLARMTLVDALLQADEPAEAEQVLGEVERGALPAEDPVVTAQEIRDARVEILTAHGDLEGALRAGEEYRKVARGRPFDRNAVINLRDLAWLLHRAGRDAEAWATFAEAAREARPLHPALVADVVMKEGLARFQRSLWTEGIACLDQAIPVLRDTGQQRMLAQSLRWRSEALHQLGRYSEAERDSAEAFRVAAASESAPEIAATRLALARLVAHGGSRDPARQDAPRTHLLEALRLTEGRTDPSSLESRAFALESLAALEEAAGVREDALRRRSEAARLRADLAKRRGYVADPFRAATPAGPGAPVFVGNYTLDVLATLRRMPPEALGGMAPEAAAEASGLGGSLQVAADGKWRGTTTSTAGDQRMWGTWVPTANGLRLTILGRDPAVAAPGSRDVAEAAWEGSVLVLTTEGQGAKQTAVFRREG